MSDSLLLDAAAAAETLGVSKRTLHRITIPRGPLPSVCIGRSVRYSLDDIRNFIAKERRATAQRVALECKSKIATQMPVPESKRDMSGFSNGEGAEL